MNYADIFEASSLVWPLCFLLISLLILRQLRDDVRPIFTGMVSALASQSQKNAMAWAIGMMLGTVASLQAVVEVAQQMHWLYIGALAKVMQPGLAAIIAYVTKSPIGPAPQPSTTTPPFPPKQP